MNKLDATREKIYQFYEKNAKAGNKLTIEHFMAEGVAQRTIYNAIQRVKDKISPKRRSGQGRPVRKMPKAKVKRLRRSFDHKQGKSQRIAARKYNITQCYVSKILKASSIKCRKKNTIPKRTEAQAVAAKTKSRLIYEKYRNFEWILDDESYFTLSHSTIGGNNNFYSSDVSATPSAVKFSSKAKYEAKILVWVAISRKGISKMFMCPSGLAVNKEIYKEQCIERRLIPFIEKYHSQDEIIFWPDLASAHYAETVCDFMIERKINFVEKYENPANVPENRPIEEFWAIFKQKVYAGGWKAKNIEELKDRIRDCIKKIDTKILISLFDAMMKKMYGVGHHGVIEKR
jgi:hypothetical protein